MRAPDGETPAEALPVLIYSFMFIIVLFVSTSLRHFSFGLFLYCNKVWYLAVVSGTHEALTACRKKASSRARI